MTGYHISIGYLSGGPYDKEDAWEILKQVALDLCNAPARIADEAISFGMNRDIATEYAAAYVGASIATRGTEDSTLRIIEANEKEGTAPQIMQLAGGADPSRSIKEAIRRAFCRLVMYEMHKREIEININVA
jgi:hypothetical protein